MATAAVHSPQQPEAKPKIPVRAWLPRMWEGLHILAWLRMLVRNRFALHWRCWYLAVIITLMSLLNTLLCGVQSLIFGRRIRRTKISKPPIFILGHWRTGTTLLHEMLILDGRHGYPTTYECMEPNHFLLSESFFTNWLWFLMPVRRPMDNMAAGFDRPQEDEFGLCMLGRPSPYLSIAFPNRPRQFEEYYDLEKVPPRARARWKRTFLYFLRLITYRQGKRLVLKSPPHTCRIKILQEMFPDAIFIHIIRDPFVVFPSTVHLWKALYEKQGLQRPKFRGLEEYVFETYLRMYNKLEETRHLVDPSRFYELRYEDLVRDPIEQMRTLYEHLQLGDFDRVLPRLESYLESVSGYETNKYELTGEQRAEIRRRWSSVIERYGYGEEHGTGRPLQGPHMQFGRWSPSAADSAPQRKTG